MLVQVKHNRTLCRFLLSKLEICDGNNEDKDSKQQQNINKIMAEHTKIIPKIK